MYWRNVSCGAHDVNSPRLWHDIGVYIDSHIEASECHMGAVVS